MDQTASWGPTDVPVSMAHFCVRRCHWELDERPGRTRARESMPGLQRFVLHSRTREMTTGTGPRRLPTGNTSESPGWEPVPIFLSDAPSLGNHSNPGACPANPPVMPKGIEQSGCARGKAPTTPTNLKFCRSCRCSFLHLVFSSHATEWPASLGGLCRSFSSVGY